jgi:hypothetical protein
MENLERPITDGEYIAGALHRNYHQAALRIHRVNSIVNGHILVAAAFLLHVVFFFGGYPMTATIGIAGCVIAWAAAWHIEGVYSMGDQKMLSRWWKPCYWASVIGTTLAWLLILLIAVSQWR